MGVRAEPGAQSTRLALLDDELPHTYVLLTPASQIAPKVCRDFVTSVLSASELAGLVDAAALCVSELVTNVHQHAVGDARLTVTVEPARVRFAVHDEDPRLPAPRTATTADTHGRGLFLVAALADLCGTSASGEAGDEPDADEPGKTVWCEFNVPLGGAS
ncbi:ATP-binding protein [Streptomyces zagrosensis]|uniref:Anti-sigma regulatory factor (Ser/Thr protein kinase) n=1 Tax=Streptomyces zagrosensis TaxID=1042984 RepID=A0A7W9V1P5_9ACTN|nr:ATP-binding protein [Streptomyces zagrosensis]MBB5939420.1 anti-sigma regulatory factor (Ser/Thr protein kinase) [Streptomyces zagrosensis]